MKIWQRIGDCELFWTMLILAAIAVWSSNALAVEPGDWELASVVVGKDGVKEVEQKLGPSACLVPSLSGETVSYLYNVGGKRLPLYLRLEVNGRVDAITLSQDPPLAGVCYAPVRTVHPMKTRQGLELGASIETVESVYGLPTESFSVGPMARFRYVAMHERPYEWDLVFRNGRLVEWTVAAQQ